MDVTVPRSIVRMSPVIIGPDSAGKSSILLRYAENIYYEEDNMTVALNMNKKEIDNVEGLNVRLLIWDLPCRSTLKERYMKTAQFVVLVCNLADQQTLERVDECFQESCKMLDIPVEERSEFPFVLLCNKCDLVGDRKVSTEAIDTFCRERGIGKYVETSAKDNIGLDEAFLYAVAKALQRPPIVRPSLEAN